MRPCHDWQEQQQPGMATTPYSETLIRICWFLMSMRTLRVNQHEAHTAWKPKQKIIANKYPCVNKNSAYKINPSHETLLLHFKYTCRPPTTRVYNSSAGGQRRRCGVTNIRLEILKKSNSQSQPQRSVCFHCKIRTFLDRLAGGSSFFVPWLTVFSQF